MCEIKFATTPIQGNFFFLPQPLRIKRLSSGIERRLAGLSLLLSLFPEYSTLRPCPVKKVSNILQIYVDIFGRVLMFNFSPHFPQKQSNWNLYFLLWWATLSPIQEIFIYSMVTKISSYIFLMKLWNWKAFIFSVSFMI